MDFQESNKNTLNPGEPHSGDETERIPSSFTFFFFSKEKSML